ncbi:ROK family transcriptional regulator [Deinococcus roseus]|uniref:Xylose repressor protein n=1 Tax=Deinococcus roseus TaxID=392414 RepID=A0ABQ2DFM3_9DEIO|nr:ROK family transcriptional regulator [Deinococcus roseus]GGJ56090.1 xylose repressor protein [Deinococcus roseus]
MTVNKGDPRALRTQNRRTILNHLRKLGPTSRAQLVDITGLSSAGITGITAELIQDRLIVERSIGEAGATGGRRPIYLDIDYTAHFAVGIKLREDRMEAVLTDLSTRVLAHRTEELTSQDPDKVALQIKVACKKLYKKARVAPEDVLGIGIGLSGVIDARHGVAINAPLFGWSNVPIAQTVSEHTGLPVWVDNDVNAFAAAERLFGHGKQFDSFLTVAIGRGLGSALVLDGNIYRGRNGGAGEFGHNMVQPGGRTCSCGRKGCLEAYTAEPALLAQFQERHPEHTGITLPNLVQLAQDGHMGAREVLETAGRLLGVHLSYLVNSFNPELIVIGGEGAQLGPFYFTPLKQTLRQQAFDSLAEDLQVVVVPWNKDDFTPWAQGAASLAVHSAFETGEVVKTLQSRPNP